MPYAKISPDAAITIDETRQNHFSTSFGKECHKQQRGGRRRVQWKWQWPEEEEMYGPREDLQRASLMFLLQGIPAYDRVVLSPFQRGVQLS